jgi:hypothetical protein
MVCGLGLQFDRRLVEPEAQTIAPRLGRLEFVDPSPPSSRFYRITGYPEP